MPIKARVFYTPGSEGRLVVLKPAWIADNWYETAAFPTQEEAINFAMKRWRVSREEIRITL